MEAKRVLISALFVGLGLLISGPALAYVGPGAGLGAIGSALALVGAVLLGIIGFVWYPMKRILRKRKALASQDDPKQTSETTGGGDK